jgi:uncharacterized protein YbjQ (UPF0145 family)
MGRATFLDFVCGAHHLQVGATVVADRPGIKRLNGGGASDMLVATTENVPGYRVTAVRGQVFGVVVRSRGIAGNFMAGLRTIIGGEIKEYTQMVEEARRHAIDRMVKNAAAMGANAVVMMRFDSSEMARSMSEIVAYGTAVVIEQER